MNSRANIIKPSKDGSFSPLQRAWQAVARRFTVGRDAVKPNFGSTETGKAHWGVVILIGHSAIGSWLRRMETLLNRFSAEELKNCLLFLGAEYDSPV